MAMEEGLDTGPVLLERQLSIGVLENAHALGHRLSRLTAELMVEAMPLIERVGPGSEPERLGKLGVRIQPEQGTYARMLTKDDFLVDWSTSALAIHRKVMALYPGALTSWRGKRLKLLSTEPLIERLREHLSDEVKDLLGRWPTGGSTGGTVLAETDAGLVVSSTGCPILIREAQLEGKTPCRDRALVQQLQARAGDALI